MISQQDLPSHATQQAPEGKSPYNAVSRFTASRSTPSLTSQIKDGPVDRTESTSPKETSSPTKPSMPWMMPSSTRGAGGFVASAALKRSSTLIKSPPTAERDIRTRPVTMYGRPMGHQRDFGGSVTSTNHANPAKPEYSQHGNTDRPSSMPVSKAVEKSVSTRSPGEYKLVSSEEKRIDEQIPKPPQHKSPPMQAFSPPTSPKPTSPPSLQTTPKTHERSPTPPTIS